MKTVASTLFAFCTIGMLGCMADSSPSDPAPTGNNTEIQALLEEFPDATQIDDHSIGWNDGQVILALPGHDTEDRTAEDRGSDLSPAATVHGCPAGWYCVYQNINFGGRRLQFSDCARNDLSDFGFRDQTSAWVNNGPHTVQVKDDLTLWPDPVLWTMSPGASSSFVGNANNDKADYFQCK
jgi:hypothetical protein